MAKVIIFIEASSKLENEINTQFIFVHEKPISLIEKQRFRKINVQFHILIHT